MLKIKQLTFRNFRSYGKVDTTIQFELPGTTLLMGVNDDGGTTNGHGKTSILLALTWVLYDKVIDNVNKDELINNINKVDMYGEVKFSIFNDEIVVARWRKAGKSFRDNGASLYINGIDSTPAGNDNINKKIQDLIGIDFELFSRIIVYSASNKSFFELPATSHYESNQTDLIEQLFDLQMLSEKATILKTQIKTTETELLVQKKLIEQAEEQLKSHKKLIDKATDRKTKWDTDHASSITVLKSDIDTVERVNFDEEKKQHDIIAECLNERRTLVSEKRTGEHSLTTISSQIQQLNTEIASLDNSVCPYCNQVYANSQEKRAHVLEQLQLADADLYALRTNIEANTKQIAGLDKIINTAKSKTTVDDFSRLIELKSTHTELQMRLSQLQDQLNPHCDTITELVNAQPVIANFDGVNQLTVLNEHQTFLLKLLTKKDSFLRKALLHKNIPILNQQLAGYLEELGLPHTVEFTHSLTAKITQFGRELSFGSLSNGQKARVNFALSLAFSDLLQIIHQKTNIQIFDEILDIGLDHHGVIAATQLLKRKAKKDTLSIFIITHKDEISNAFDRQLIIKQKDDFSYIESTTTPV